MPLGAFLGTFITQPIVLTVGERKAMINLDVFGAIIMMYQVFHVGAYHLYVTRFLLGLYLGVSTNILPSYLVSIAPP